MNSRTVQVLGDHVAHVDTTRKVVALTFDDGPSDLFASELIADLQRYDAHATFYVIGAAAADAAGGVAQPHRLRPGDRQPHATTIAGWSSCPPPRPSEEVTSADAVIRAAGYTRPITVRPPYGKKLLSLPWELWGGDRMTVMWDLEPDSLEGIRRDPAAMTQYVMDNVRPGSIILLHPWTTGERRDPRGAAGDPGRPPRSRLRGRHRLRAAGAAVDGFSSAPRGNRTLSEREVDVAGSAETGKGARGRPREAGDEAGRGLARLSLRRQGQGQGGRPHRGARRPAHARISSCGSTSTCPPRRRSSSCARSSSSSEDEFERRGRACRSGSAADYFSFTIPTLPSRRRTTPSSRPSPASSLTRWLVTAHKTDDRRSSTRSTSTSTRTAPWGSSTRPTSSPRCSSGSSTSSSSPWSGAARHRPHRGAHPRATS